METDSQQIATHPVALVTGGTRGIGLAISRRLASMGYCLVVNGVRNESEVTTVLAQLHADGAPRACYFQADIANSNARNRMVDFVLSTFGGINLLVNNAGIAPRERKDLLEASEDSFEQLVRTNLQGPYFLTQRVAREMIRLEQSNGVKQRCIITVSSISSVVPSVNRGEYCIAKSGLSMMTKLFAARLGEENIPVYEIQPGIIQTDMTSGVKEKYDSLIEGGLTVEKRWGFPEDIASAVAVLAKGDLPYATGQVLKIDGGLTLQRL